MRALSVSNLTREFPSGGGVRRVSLEVAAGEFLVLLGPSGCGKTTLLRLIAGLDIPSAGTIEFGDRSGSGNANSRGRIAMVFQNLALYPHMSAFENIAFPLRLIKLAPAQIDRRVRETAARAGLSAGLERRPAELSGGERQRVALARALVRDPEIILMDEALASLDARLRTSVRVELKNLQRATRRTFILVTHDQIEALALADRVAVMRAGRIEQIGSPEEIFNRPETEFVAGFVGEPAMNFFDARIAMDRGGLEIGGVRIPAAVPAGAPEAVRVGLRPADLALEPAAGAASIELKIHSVEFSGASFIVRGSLAHPGGGQQSGTSLICALATRRVEPGETHRCFFYPAKLHLFDPVSGRRID
ncbi:MAG TPA: ABC transporter ATP-binding protein [Candidatus Binataceae bacterium]|nr:ABC transporter ATP-binding protein [Candidatus Binataceae bacterium]